VKKSLKGFIKSRHFQERQNERSVSDREIVKAILKGELIQHEGGLFFQLGNLKVTVDHAQEILITVHPGEKDLKKNKVLSKEDALKIREQIQKEADKIQEEDDFLKFVRENKVKKMS
jgi:hypothetical protein